MTPSIPLAPADMFFFPKFHRCRRGRMRARPRASPRGQSTGQAVDPPMACDRDCGAAARIDRVGAASGRRDVSCRCDDCWEGPRMSLSSSSNAAAATNKNIDADIVFETIVSGLHWSVLHIGTIANLANACLQRQADWTLWPSRHLVRENSKMMQAPSRYRADIGLSAAIGDDLAALSARLTDVKAQTTGIATAFCSRRRWRATTLYSDAVSMPRDDCVGTAVCRRSSVCAKRLQRGSRTISTRSKVVQQ